MNNSPSESSLPQPEGPDGQHAAAPSSIKLSRRGLLGAGSAATLFAAGGLGLASGRAEAAVAKAANAPRAVACLEFLTPVTPPHGGTTAANIINSTAAQRMAYNTTAVTYRIDPRRGAASTAAATELATRIATSARESVGELVGFELINNTSIDAPTIWHDDVGVGPSSVTLKFGDTSAPIVIPVAGANVVDVRAAVMRMRTVPSLRDEMLMQADTPQMYLAYASGLDNYVLSRPKELIYWTCDAIDAVQALSATIVKVLKNRLNVPRPQQVTTVAGTSPIPGVVTPVLQTPVYQSYPGGHATVMYALHTVLVDITGASAAQAATFEQLVERICLNRELAGLHTSIDTKAGKALGTALGKGLLRAVGDSAYPIWSNICSQARNEWIGSVTTAPAKSS